jgi:hypothetical protein
MHDLERKGDLPTLHATFLQTALPRLQADERLVAVAAGGSFLTGGMDEYSDLDLVIAVEPLPCRRSCRNARRSRRASGRCWRPSPQNTLGSRAS